MKLLSILISIIIMACLLPVNVPAHQPVLVDKGQNSLERPYIIKQPVISKALFSTLNGTPHYYQLSSDTPFNFYMGITVPKIEGCEDFRKFSVSVLDENQQVLQELDGESFQWWPWYEKYAKKWYWIGPEYGEDFKSRHVFEAGTYYIKVYNRDNKGNYVLAVGDEEKFTPIQMLKTWFILPGINRQFWDDSSCQSGKDNNNISE